MHDCRDESFAAKALRCRRDAPPSRCFTYPHKRAGEPPLIQAMPDASDCILFSHLLCPESDSLDVVLLEGHHACEVEDFLALAEALTASMREGMLWLSNDSSDLNGKGTLSRNALSQIAKEPDVAAMAFVDRLPRQGQRNLFHRGPSPALPDLTLLQTGTKPFTRSSGISWPGAVSASSIRQPGACRASFLAAGLLRTDGSITRPRTPVTGPGLLLLHGTSVGRGP
jgi:hypothetical protein